MQRLRRCGERPWRFDAVSSVMSIRLRRKHSAISDMFWNVGDQAAAEARYQEALSIWQQLVEEDPRKCPCLIARWRNIMRKGRNTTKQLSEYREGGCNRPTFYDTV